MSTKTKLSSSMLDMLSLSNTVWDDIASWDDHYDDPKADIILVSNDKVGFRVEARHFQKEW
jgi:hypothetical protein